MSNCLMPEVLSLQQVSDQSYLVTLDGIEEENVKPVKDILHSYGVQWSPKFLGYILPIKKATKCISQIQAQMPQLILDDVDLKGIVELTHARKDPQTKTWMMQSPETWKRYIYHDPTMSGRAKHVLKRSKAGVKPKVLVLCPTVKTTFWSQNCAQMPVIYRLGQAPTSLTVWSYCQLETNQSQLSLNSFDMLVCDQILSAETDSYPGAFGRQMTRPREHKHGTCQIISSNYDDSKDLICTVTKLPLTNIQSLVKVLSLLYPCRNHKWMFKRYRKNSSRAKQLLFVLRRSVLIHANPSGRVSEVLMAVPDNFTHNSTSILFNSSQETKFYSRNSPVTSSRQNSNLSLLLQQYVGHLCRDIGVRVLMLAQSQFELDQFHVALSPLRIPYQTQRSFDGTPRLQQFPKRCHLFLMNAQDQLFQGSLPRVSHIVSLGLDSDLVSDYIQTNIKTTRNPFITHHKFIPNSQFRLNSLIPQQVLLQDFDESSVRPKQQLSNRINEDRLIPFITKMVDSNSKQFELSAIVAPFDADKVGLTHGRLACRDRAIPILDDSIEENVDISSEDCLTRLQPYCPSSKDNSPYVVPFDSPEQEEEMQIFKRQLLNEQYNQQQQEFMGLNSVQIINQSHNCQLNLQISLESSQHRLQENQQIDQFHLGVSDSESMRLQDSIFDNKSNNSYSHHQRHKEQCKLYSSQPSNTEEDNFKKYQPFHSIIIGLQTSSDTSPVVQIPLQDIKSQAILTQGNAQTKNNLTIVVQLGKYKPIKPIRSQ